MKNIQQVNVLMLLQYANMSDHHFFPVPCILCSGALLSYFLTCYCECSKLISAIVQNSFSKISKPKLFTNCNEICFL